MATYVLVFGKLHRLEDKETFETIFEQVSRTIMQDVKGIVRDELIRDTNDPYTYIMLSEWEDKDAWARWQCTATHVEQVGSIQQYWKGQGVAICNTVFCVEPTHTEEE